jgi:hypothetical protein
MTAWTERFLPVGGGLLPVETPVAAQAIPAIAPFRDSEIRPHNRLLA